MELCLASHEQLERFRYLPGGNGGNDREDDTRGIAGRRRARRRHLGKNTAQARRDAGADGHLETVCADGGAIDPGLSQLDCRVIDQITGLEIVCSVKDQIC